MNHRAVLDYLGAWAQANFLAQDELAGWSLFEYEELAGICGISKSTTYHWLGGQTSRREAGEPYQRIMAVADFLLTNAERVQLLLERWHTMQ
jgi:hypothetical protein